MLSDLRTGFSPNAVPSVFHSPHESPSKLAKTMSLVAASFSPRPGFAGREVGGEGSSSSSVVLIPSSTSRFAASRYTSSLSSAGLASLTRLPSTTDR